MNGAIHRSYSNFGDHIRVTVYDDRIEVSNPGHFPGLITLNDLTDVKRFARNPRIARVMADLSYGQELGEGLMRMVTMMESSGRQRPVVRQEGGATLVTLLGEVVGPNELGRVDKWILRTWDAGNCYGLPLVGGREYLLGGDF